MAEQRDQPPSRPAESPAASLRWSSYQSGMRPPSWTDVFDPRQPEAFLAMCSAWSAIQLAAWPSQFRSDDALMSAAIGLCGHEPVWACFAGVAAVLKIAGLASRLSIRWREFSAGLLTSGLFMSVIFWLIIGLSRAVDFPHSITPLALVGIGVGAGCELVRHRDTRDFWR